MRFPDGLNQKINDILAQKFLEIINVNGVKNGLQTGTS